jgi:hypothetical protein
MTEGYEDADAERSYIGMKLDAAVDFDVFITRSDGGDGYVFDAGYAE